MRCCDFHGCGNYKIHRPCGKDLKDGNHQFLSKCVVYALMFGIIKIERWKIEGKHFKFKETLHLHRKAIFMVV
jgi:hypothetical protein